MGAFRRTRSVSLCSSGWQKIANGDLYATPATIDDPAVLAEIETAMAHVGYAKSKLEELRNEVRNLAFAIWVAKITPPSAPSANRRLSERPIGVL